MAKKLMIVDSRAVSRHLVRRVVAMAQDTVLECHTADEALKAVGIFRPDCVVIGVAGQGDAAYAAMRDIRDTYPQVRVVALSDSHETHVQQKAADAGVYSYVTSQNLSELFLVAAPERLASHPVRRVKSRRPAKNTSAE